MRSIPIHLALFGLLAVASPALASPAIPIGGGKVTSSGRTVLISRTADGIETAVEEAKLKTTAQQIVWLMPLPSAPLEVKAVAPEAMSALVRETQVRAPRSEELKRQIFGPSVLSLWLHDSQTATAAPETEPPRVALGELRMFQGPIITSTTSNRRFLPNAMQGWLENAGAKLTPLQLDGVLSYLDRGWTIAAASVPVDSPEIVLGPTMFRFRSEGAVYPLLLNLGDDNDLLRFRIFTFGESALVPDARIVRWDPRGWDPQPSDERGTFRVVYSRPLDGRLKESITELLAAPPPEGWLIGAEYQIVDLTGSDLALGPRDSPLRLPARHRREGPLDLFLCVLLGMMPLFYTPEAWVLLWLSYNAHAERRPNTPLAARGYLWGVYALIVALFWLLTASGLGRIAAFGPLVAGIAALWPRTAREARPVRVDFRRKKKPGARPTVKPAPARSSGAPKA